ncbi:RNA polymerase sigma factor [uncultured Robinsoniella sp.]|uniref:RNA polymerase sigma factor n=1 Tax=uncultured Robinsoniella sp. TaxID=904190 RepID=UPI00374F81B2
MILFCLIPEEQNEIKRLGQIVKEELFIQIAEGDVQALETLYYQTYQAVYGFILSILKNQYDAEDILQETYIKIKTGAHLYKPQGKPLAWIFTIARNLSYMKIRKDKNTQTSPYEELENMLDFSAVEDKENKLLLEAAFSILGDEERQIIILHANTGMKHREIAALVKLPLSTVLSKYNRGMKKLRNYIEGRMS